MNTPPSPDRETLQQLLANAFAVQQSNINSQALSDIMILQRSVARGKVDLEGAMRLIVESARNVASATGVAIALLKGHQLTYCAGSGTVADCVGQHVTASLTVSANTRMNREILRVENAQTDTRIEAAICRQFGANALLILPIYNDGAIAGVLDVRFSEPHAFENREVQAYRLMAEQIEAALFHAHQSDQTKVLAPQLPPNDLGEFETLPDDFVPPPDFMMLPENEHSLYARCGAVFAAITQLPGFRQSGVLATTIARRAKTVQLPTLPKVSMHLPSRERKSALRSSVVQRTSAFRSSVVQGTSAFRSSVVQRTSQLAQYRSRLVATMSQRAKDLNLQRWRSATQTSVKAFSSVIDRSISFTTRHTENLRWPDQWVTSTQAMAAKGSLAARRSALLARQRAANLLRTSRGRELAVLSFAVLLAFAAFVAFRGRGTAKSLESATLPSTSAIDTMNHSPKPHPGQGGAIVDATRDGSKSFKTANTSLKRVRVNAREVDYIGDDVTVRIFNDRPPVKHTRIAAGRVSHYGDDVTVRYFTPLPVTAKTASR